MDTTEFEQFFAARVAAAESFVNGDAAPVLALLPKDSAATFLGPSGESLSGSAVVAETFGRHAALFTQGGSSRLEILQKGDGGDLGFWTGFQIVTARIRGSDRLQDMKVRVTEVFRRAEGTWKLVHRHADFGAAK